MELPEFYFSFQVFWLRLLGIEVLVKNESLFYRIYSAFALSIAGTYVLVECIELSFHSDFDTLVVVANYVFSHTLGVVKVAVMYTFRKKIGDLLVSLHEGVFKPDEERGGNFEKECIGKTLRRTSSQLFTYGFSIFIVVIAGMATSLKSRLVEPPEMWKLPFTPLSWINTSCSPGFEIAYIYQTIPINMVTVYIYISDYTIINIIAQVSAQVKILERCIRSYESRGLNNHLKNRTISAEQSVKDSLDATIEHHLHLLTTVDTVEYLCCYLVLCVFLSNLVLLCLLMYCTSTMPLKSIEFVQYLAFCFVIALQIFLYCWWGNEITLANEAVALSAAETYNPDRPLFHGKALKLMMIRAQRPLFLTAGKFAPLSIETYKGIIKGSFSYFTVLRQMNSK